MIASCLSCDKSSLWHFIFAAFLSLCSCRRWWVRAAFFSLHCYTIRNTSCQSEQRWQSKMSVTIGSRLFDMCVWMKRAPCLMWPAEDVMSNKIEFVLVEWLSFLFFQKQSRTDSNSMFELQPSPRKWCSSLQAAGLNKLLIPEFFPTQLNTDWSQHWLFLLKAWGLWRAKG